MQHLNLAATSECADARGTASADTPAPTGVPRPTSRTRLDRRYLTGCVAGLLLGGALAVPVAYAWLRASSGPLERDRQPDTLAALIASGRLALAEKDPERALTQFRAAVQLAPGDARAHNNVCVALNELGRHAEALAACTTAVALQPEFRLARNNLAWAKAQLERTPAASPH